MRGGKRSSNESRNNATSRLTCMNHYSQHLDTLVSVCSLLAQSTCHRRRSWRSCLSEQRRRHDGPQATRCASLSSAISELDPPLLAVNYEMDSIFASIAAAKTGRMPC